MRKNKKSVIVSEANNLSWLLFRYLNRREILRFAQNDRTRHFFPQSVKSALRMDGIVHKILFETLAAQGNSEFFCIRESITIVGLFFPETGMLELIRLVWISRRQKQRVLLGRALP